MRSIAAVLALVLATVVAVPISDTTTTTRACQKPHDSYPFCNTDLSVDDRVRNVISLLTSQEKLLFLKAREGGGGSPPPPNNITRLGLPEYDWGLNCIHGVQSTCVTNHDGKVYCPTSFPNPVNMGAMFDMSIVEEMGKVLGAETRALWLAGAKEASKWSGQPHIGLDCWSPNININRDPRWGRNQEVPSEDPYLAGQFGTAYSLGLQNGDDKRYVQAITTLKHWDAYSLEDSEGYTRHNFNAIITNQTLSDTYFPAFREAVVTGGALGVMCSYNAINGIPTCAHPLLREVLRTKWKFEGYVTSDTGAIDDITSQHHYTKTPEAGACVAIKQGQCDLDSGPVYFEHILGGVSQGLCSMADIDNALFRMFKLRFQLGLFDPIDSQPYWHTPITSVNTTGAQFLNYVMTLKSMVLLKNENHTLPLARGRRIAVIGPHYKAQSAFVGNYLGQICPENESTMDCVTTLLDAIKAMNMGGVTMGVEGCPMTLPVRSGFDAAVATAKAADYVVLALGIDESIEAESHDRTSIDLPAIQHELAAAIFAVGRPTTVVLINGGMVAIAPEKTRASAILEAFYPGFWGGRAIAATLFGENEYLGGKLPITIYDANYINEVKMSNMEMAPSDASPGRSYKYYTGTPLYPFGYGLSYTNFSLAWVEPPDTKALQTNGTLVHAYMIRVTNIGTRSGDEVVMGYFIPSSLTHHKSAIKKQLFGFQRVHLDPGQSTTLHFTISRETLQLAVATGDVVSTPGTYGIVFNNGLSAELSFNLPVIGQEVILDMFPRSY